MKNFKQMENSFLETRRLFLRKFDNSDLDLLMPIMGDPEVQKFSPYGCEDRIGIQKFLDGCKLREARDGVTQYAIILKETNELIGDCGITIQQVDGISEYEIGYKLARKQWGQGYATEAAVACRDFGFEQKNIQRFISIIDPKNISSIRVAARVGMTLEKESLYRNGIVEIYSLSKK